MDQLILSSYAKVNLTLDVLEKRQEDRYHYVDMVMVPITLADEVRLRLAPEVTVTSEPEIPGPAEANLAFRAARILKTATGYSGGASIHITKVIPVAGGLAGGSTNAAAVLTGLNQLWGTRLTVQELIMLAIRLGSDVPFFVPCRPARVGGVGERLAPLKAAQPIWMVLATPDVAKSTGNVYRLFDELERVSRPDTNAMAAALAAGDARAVAGALGNVFEQVMLPRHPEISELKAAMLRGGALGALMSGAGPTVFGVVSDEDAGRRLVANLPAKAGRAWLAHTVGH
jgi:4-diphosphocytidyl-2-C-methyl-D-erythritol kinase